MCLLPQREEPNPFLHPKTTAPGKKLSRHSFPLLFSTVSMTLHFCFWPCFMISLGSETELAGIRSPADPLEGNTGAGSLHVGPCAGGAATPWHWAVSLTNALDVRARVLSIERIVVLASSQDTEPTALHLLSLVEPSLPYTCLPLGFQSFLIENTVVNLFSPPNCQSYFETPLKLS